MVMRAFASNRAAGGIFESSPVTKTGRPWEGALAAEQQRMHVPRLRRSRAVRRLRGQSVALQHNYLIEAVGECPRRREPGHTGADHDRLLANHSRCHRHLPTACSAAIYKLMASHLIKLQPQSKKD